MKQTPNKFPFKKNNTLRIKILTLFALGISGLLLTGCVTQKKHDMALDRIDQLERQRHALARTNAQMRALQEQEMVDYNEYLASNYVEARKDVDSLALHLSKTYRRLDLAKASLRELADSLESAFALFLPEEIQVVQDRGQIKVLFHDRIFFETAKAKVSDQGKEALRSMAFVLNNTDQEIMVNVIGHSDDRKVKNGRLRDNWQLSAMRGTAVVRVLEEAGIDPRILTASGRSKYDPLSTNETDLGRAMNRRTEIVLIPDLTEAVYSLLIGQR